MSDFLLSVAEAADILGIHRDTAYVLLREDKFPVPVIRLGRLIKVPKLPLMRFVETGSYEAAS